jgi:hypothetical protein
MLMQLPAEIAEQITTAIQALDPAAGWLDELGHRHSAIPLYADIGGAVLLRSDGVFLELEWDQETEHHPRECSDLTSTVPLVAGAERYPWLKGLLPVRPSDARPCTSCQGLGRIVLTNGSGRILCGVCGALGWKASSP